MFTQTNHEAAVDDDNGLPYPPNSDEESTQWPDESLDTSNIPAVEGRTPFRPAHLITLRAVLPMIKVGLA